MKKLRPLGDITTDMEPLLYEMADDHNMQVHEILGIIKAWVDVHYPSANEEYVDGSGSPILRGSHYGIDNKKKKS